MSDWMDEIAVGLVDVAAGLAEMDAVAQNHCNHALAAQLRVLRTLAEDLSATLPTADCEACRGL